REHPVECAARLERAGVLHELQLEHESSGDAEGAALQLGDRRVADPRPQEVAGALHVEAGDVERLLAWRKGAHRACGTMPNAAGHPDGSARDPRLTRRHVEPTVRTRTTGRGRASGKGATTSERTVVEGVGVSTDH